MLGQAVKRLVQGTKGLLLGVLVVLLAASPAWATEFHGQVVSGGLPVPGAQATVTATQGDKTVTAVTDDQGLFTFPDLTDGAWTLTITLTGFAPVKEPITVMPNSPIPVFELKLQTLDQIRAENKPVKVEPNTTPLVASTAVDSAVTGSGTADAGKAGANAKPAANAKGQTQTASNDAPPPPPPQDTTPDGFLINGSVNNAATSQFSLNQAFGNARNSRSLYNTLVSLQLSSSSLNANSYSLLGASPKPNFNNYTAQFTFGGPLKIPHLLPLYRAPNFTINYGHAATTSVNIRNALVPTGAQQDGSYDISSLAALTGTTVYVPAATNLSAACLGTLGIVPGNPFPGNIIPASCISPVATNLLKFYPAQNATGVSGYNYQIPLATDSHTDFGRLNLSKQFGNKNNLNGNYAMQSQRQSSPNLFGFVDRQRNLGQNLNANWSHRFTQRFYGNLTYNFSRQRSDTTINFQDKQNVSALAGISGNLQDPADYGPPSLNFNQVSGLYDSNSQNNRFQTQGVSVNLSWNRFRHEMQFGGDFRRQEFNYFTQANPRGNIGFIGVTSPTTGLPVQRTSNSSGKGGLDFADFLLGLPDTSTIAYGNADKYLRQEVYNLFWKDDFRVSPELSVNFGLRYEYGAPMTELKDRLVNLDFGSNFANKATVLASNPIGVNGQHLPNSLLRPDRAGWAPSAAIAWRPISGSSLLVRSGFGIYHDTSVYQQMAYAMAQQAPLSTSFSVSNGPGCLLNIASPFPQNCATAATDTFAVDPNFRVGYVQMWNLSVQRDLPAAMQVVVTYTGSKGLRGVQEILPNTYPLGGAPVPCNFNPCAGFAYRMSNGNSTFEGGQVQLRRRLRAGFQANATYTYSKSLDDEYSYGGSAPVFGTTSSGGSSAVAQDWRHPEAQRGLSTFDQRHKLNLQLQYTTGMGLGGHALMSGWRGAIYKDWTVVTNITVASGLPQTPIDPVAVPGSTYTGIIRANYLGGPIHQQTDAQHFLNQGAFNVPTNGWGTAPRDFIIGPNQFGMDATMQRTFRLHYLHDRMSMDANIVASNVLNHFTYNNWVMNLPSVNQTSGVSQFGTPTSFNQSRSVNARLSLRF